MKNRKNKKKQKMTNISYDQAIASYYNGEKKYFSYSGINKLLYSPKLFFDHYILNLREDRMDPHLLAGRVLHCLLLEPENFDDNFLILPDKLPTGNNKAIVEEMFRLYKDNPEYHGATLDSFETQILDYLVNVNLHQSLKTDESRLTKVLTEQNKEYFKFLVDAEGMTVVDMEIKKQCEETVDMLKKQENVMNLMQIGSDNPSLIVSNEKTLQYDLPDYGFGLKGIVDNIVIDPRNKRVFVNDLKTTNKNIETFPETVEYYRYWMQAVVYKMLVANTLWGEEYDIKVDDYDFIITFVVVDKFNQIYPFQVSQKTLKEWEERFKNILKIVHYHYDGVDYGLPYELATGKIML